MEIENRFNEGVKDGIPIALGYLSVSFTFGMMAVTQGIPVGVAVMISLTNLTSAGQFAALPILQMQNAYVEMALTQLVINLRYALMSLSLSQKVEEKCKGVERSIMAYAITDEIYAVAVNKSRKIGKKYFFGLSLMPMIGWTLGTLLGATITDFLPTSLANALQIAIYGMFLAIVLPPAKQDKAVLIVVVFAALLQCLLSSLDAIIMIGGGFSIIVVTIAVAGIMAYVAPIKENENE